MGYLPQFKNDLFVSYRRSANATHDKWVDAFCNELRSSLNELVGRDVSIWRDSDQLRTGEAWRQDLHTAIEGTAIFLAVISRSYLQSDECRKELDEFLRCMKNAGNVPRKIFPVFKQPPNPEVPTPPEVSALQRHEFFQWAPPGSPHWRELAPRTGEGDGRDFYESLSRLAQDIMLSLEELEGEVRRRARGKVFVARVCPELEPQRERLRADLQMRGYLVVPRNEYLWNADDLRAQIEADLDGALLCVHLVTGARSNDADSAAHSRLQLVMAHNATKAGDRPEPLVWIQPGQGVDPSARELLDTIESDLANEGVEYWRGSLEDLKTQIYDKLPGAAAPERALPVGGDVALLVEQGDIGQDGALRTLLADRLGVDPKLVKFTGAAPKEADRLARTLVACPRCIVFWSGQPQEWLDDVLALPELATHLGRDRLCVYVVGTPSPEKAVFRSAKATVVDAAADAAEATLRAFFGGAAG